MMMYSVQILVNHKDYGQYKGVKFELNEEKLEEIKKSVSSNISKGSFEFTSEDGSFIIFPSKIINESIIEIDIEEI